MEAELAEEIASDDIASQCFCELSLDCTSRERSRRV